MCVLSGNLVTLFVPSDNGLRDCVDEYSNKNSSTFVYIAVVYSLLANIR